MSQTNKNPKQAKSRKKPLGKHPPRDYTRVLAETVQLIRASRQRVLVAVNRELIWLYWQIGITIVHQQEKAKWGEAVVENFTKDLRATFPDLKGLSRANVFQMRQLIHACRVIEDWITTKDAMPESKARSVMSPSKKVVAVSGQFNTPSQKAQNGIVQTVSGQFHITGFSSDLGEFILNVSWSHHTTLLSRCESPAEHYFYLKMSVHERWSVRELRRQIDADLFARYVSATSHPEQYLPAKAESGDLLPFRDHYVLEFLGLKDQHSELELRQAILANLRDFFLEFGKDLRSFLILKS